MSKVVVDGGDGIQSLNFELKSFNNNNIRKPSSSPSNKRLFFDSRYGWVYDEWTNPSEEALAGGRGMFCILPLANNLVKVASQSINHVSSFVVNVLERPEEFSPQALQASLKDNIQKLISSMNHDDGEVRVKRAWDPNHVHEFPVRGNKSCLCLLANSQVGETCRFLSTS